MRGKRKRDGKFYNEDDRPIAESLAITVRGQQLIVLNDVRRLALNVGQSQNLLAWFVRELSQDLRDAQGEVADEAEAEVDAPVPDPIEDEPREPPAPGDAAGVGRPMG